MKPTSDPFGNAVIEYLSNKSDAKITVESNLTEDEEIPVSYLFRKENDLPEKELFALQNVQGRILDVGAGSGTHSLLLQAQGHEVVAIDISELCVDAMKIQGIKYTACVDFFEYQDTEKFDTILFLMNGFGIAGTLENLEPLFLKCKSLLKPNGIIIGESADILYLFEEDDGSCAIDINGVYYGEMTYKMTYKNTVGDWFPWLYISSDLLTDCADQSGFQLKEIKHGSDDDFMICFQLKS
ncbi:class I SAM-dependent methyltransferase [uncultured Cytophaga sp.]|uniref:class I SAM-dependent methyltransferase n=1 Tax=uncultured Cytophaga sp. TaxID=160238 RepID=UPI00261E77BC|nr:class I SAM-dependent methyltransferase [uncultured Cytophaga sp.]